MFGSEVDPITLALVVGGLVVAAVITVRRIKRGDLPASPTPGQRVASGVVLVAILAASAIDFAGWNPFGGYTKLVMGAVWLVSMLFVLRLLAVLERP